MLLLALKLVKSCINYKDSNDLADRIIKKQYFENSTHIVNTILNENESNNKITYLKSMKGPFFVASRHGDSAKDHVDYQGKIYYDEKGNFSKKGRQYIKQHNLKSIQWVTGAPVWFITRPHCRHYFVQYSEDDILSGNYTIPTRNIGMKAMKTPAHATLDLYQRRLQTLEILNAKRSNEVLRNKIEKTKLLIRKWKREI